MTHNMKTEDRVGEYLMHEDTTWGLGHEFQGARAGLTVDTTWLKTEVTRLCCKAKYRQNAFDIKKIRRGHLWGMERETANRGTHWVRPLLCEVFKRCPIPY